MPQVYGPITIKEVYTTKWNSLGREQASAQGRITINDKEESILVSAFDAEIQQVENLQIGAKYNLKGLMRRKITSFNGELKVSFFLNLTD